MPQLGIKRGRAPLRRTSATDPRLLAHGAVPVLPLSTSTFAGFMSVFFVWRLPHDQTHCLGARDTLGTRYTKLDALGAASVFHHLPPPSLLK